MNASVERWTNFGLISGLSKEVSERIACLLDNQVLDMQRNVDDLSSLGEDGAVVLPLIRFIFAEYDVMAVSIPRVMRQDRSPGKSFRRQRLGTFHLTPTNVYNSDKINEVKTAFESLANGQMLYVNVPFKIISKESVNGQQIYTFDTLVGIDQ